MGDQLEIKDFGDFKVYNLEDNYTFFHIDITDENKFLNGLCRYLLDENVLLKYAENKSAIKFSPSSKNYVSLFKLLHKFIDDENMHIALVDSEIEEILIDEFGDVIDQDGKKFIRLSKVGRIGEYMFHTFLSNYFSFSCILPKVHLVTDRNMSVYGIDVLFFDKVRKMILFGESKVTKRIKNGIALVNKSLQNYEKEINEEFELVLSNSHLVCFELEEFFPGAREVCVNFSEFIKKTATKCIGVPIFIAHGEEVLHDDILKKLKQGVKRHKFFGLETIYFAISLPIINKEKLLTCLTQAIAEKMKMYDEGRAI